MADPLTDLGRLLQTLGFQVGENPAFGGVDPVHKTNSLHYSGQAIDVNWPGGGATELGKLRAVYDQLKPRGLTELLLEDAGTSNQHLHIGIAGGGGSAVSAQSDLQQFVSGVSQATGLDPRTVTAWAKQEGAYAPGGTGGHNYLNLRPYPGDPYSSVTSGNFENFASVQDAIKATVRRLQQPFASPIIASAKGTPKQEIAAIASTGWDAGHYGGTGGPNLSRTFAGLYGQAALNTDAAGPSGYLTIPSGDLPIVGGTAAERGAGSLQNPLTGAGQAVGDVGGKIVDATGLGGVKDFLTSWRFAEVVGGFLLLIVGLILLGRHFGIRPPVPGPIGAAASGVDSTFQFAPGERDYAAAQPTSRPARARTERVSLPADRPAARRPAVRTADAVPY